MSLGIKSLAGPVSLFNTKIWVAAGDEGIVSSPECDVEHPPKIPCRSGGSLKDLNLVLIDESAVSFMLFWHRMMSIGIERVGLQAAEAIKDVSAICLGKPLPAGGVAECIADESAKQIGRPMLGVLVLAHRIYGLALPGGCLIYLRQIPSYQGYLASIAVLPPFLAL